VKISRRWGGINLGERRRHDTSRSWRYLVLYLRPCMLQSGVMLERKIWGFVMLCGFCFFIGKCSRSSESVTFQLRCCDGHLL